MKIFTNVLNKTCHGWLNCIFDRNTRRNNDERKFCNFWSSTEWKSWGFFVLHRLQKFLKNCQDFIMRTLETGVQFSGYFFQKYCLFLRNLKIFTNFLNTKCHGWVNCFFERKTRPKTNERKFWNFLSSREWKSWFFFVLHRLQKFLKNCQDFINW